MYYIDSTCITIINTSVNFCRRCFGFFWNIWNLKLPNSTILSSCFVGNRRFGPGKDRNPGGNPGGNPGRNPDHHPFAHTSFVEM